MSSLEKLEKLKSDNRKLQAEIRDLKATATRCACQVKEVPACKKSCTCRRPFLSGGCNRCATYGNRKQRASSARHVAWHIRCVQARS